MMNQVVRRIFAGVLAVILSVSAIGSDTLIGNFRQTLHADSDEIVLKQGSTDFFNPEQDTIIDKSGNKIYNTNYGLHTDKIVSKAYSDGRTFDLDLESWYIGEKPVDVGLVLDASGSMAWTTNTLYPLEISSERIVELKAEQEANGGYLTENTVETILNPENTDNTKLGYDGYKYYVYEDRSAVSEFVPLGYWDGGSPLIDESLIGYYPFNGNLNNEAPNAADDTEGKFIEQDSTGFDTDKPASSSLAKFSDGGLDLYNTDKSGNVVIDLSSLKEKDFSLSFSVCLDSSGNSKYNTPLVYVGNASGNKYYSLFRGNINDSGGGNAKRFRVVVNDGSGSKQSGAIADNGNKEGVWLNCSMTFKYDSTEEAYIGSCTANGRSPEQKDSIDYNNFKFAVDDSLYLILGGNDVLVYDTTGEDISKNKIKDLKITTDSGEVANFPLSGNLKNTITDKGIGNAFLMKDGTDGSFNVTEEVESTLVSPQYNEDGTALDLNETAKNGAVMLKAFSGISSGSSFTISMRLQKNGSLDKVENNQRNLFYLGDKGKEDYLQFFRSAETGGCLVLSHNNQNDRQDDSDLHYVGGLASNDWYTNTLVFEPVTDGYKVTPYVNGKPSELRGDKKQFPNGTDKWGDSNEPESISFNIKSEDIVFLLGALQSNSSGSEHYIDDVYIFNSALNPEKVSCYFGDGSIGSCNVSNAAHAVTADGTEIAQIARTSSDDTNSEKYKNRTRLADNSNHEERRGWYYVNSHSDWGDIDTETDLTSGKQYIGILTELPNEDGVKDHTVKGEVVYDHSDKATVPSAYTDTKLLNSINEVNGSHTDYDPPTTERSIRFYVDDAGHLRCFVWSGGDSTYETEKDEKGNEKTDSSKNKIPAKDDVGYPIVKEERTFCSVVYVNPEVGKEKHSELRTCIHREKVI